MSRPTPGQQLALDQLKAIATASRAALAIGASSDPPAAGGPLTVEVILDFPPDTVKSGGVPLERTERAILHITPGFPYKPPTVEAGRDQFADQPHVQWRRQICLYQSPLDWDAGEGMMGLITRLSSWYRRAASGTLDGPGQPLHPPVAYTSSWAGCMVIRENVPHDVALGEKTWCGAAVLCQAGEQRVDLVGWLGQHGEVYTDTERLYSELAKEEGKRGRRVFLAAAVMLPGPMTFEFPTRAGALVDAIDGQGVTPTALAELLGDVAWINEVRARQAADTQDTDRVAFPPMYALIGTPMRGIAGSNERRTHLAAWWLHGDEARLTSALVQLWARPEPGQTEVVRAATEAVNSWMDTASAQWATVYEERPEIVERRDDKRPAQWLRGDRPDAPRKVMVLGCGALGAHVAEHCLRARAGRLTLVDNARVDPGILVRQPYEDADVGKPKARVLGTRLRYIRPDADIEVIEDNALDTVLADSQPPEVDLVIDATASPTVASKIEYCRWASQLKWPPVLSVAIGHLAERGIATLALPNASGGGADIMRRLALTARSTSHLGDVADDFFPDPPRATLFQPEPGCSEPTFRGSAADVQALASQLFAAALHDLWTGTEGTPAASMSARIARLPYAAGAHTYDLVTWADDHAVVNRESGYQIRFAAAALDSMQDEAYGTRSAQGPTVETGGMLLGLIDDASRVIWVTAAAGPAPGSKQASSYITLSTAGAAGLITALERQSAGRTRFIGMWHTHPRAQPYESTTDRAAMHSLLTNAEHPIHRALLVVLGGEPSQWDAWLEGDGAPAIYTRLARRSA